MSNRWCHKIPGAWITAPLIWLLIAAATGTFLRYIHLWPVDGVRFSFLLHGHSHAAMLGWGYSAAFLFLMVYVFPAFLDSRFLKYWFWLVQVSVAGMVIAFPLQGYALYSIIFSTLHMLLFYVFTGWMLKQYRHKAGEGSASYGLLFAALTFMILSSAGPWSLGILSAQGMQGSSVYELSLQFYLHFQIEGWFILILAAIAVPALKTRRSIVFQAHRWHLIAFALALPLLFGLNISNYYEHAFWEHIALAGGLLQAGVVIDIFRRNRNQVIHMLNGPSAYLGYISLAAILIKFIFQLLVVMPWIDPSIIHVRPFRIGYLHWVLLFVLTSGLLWLYVQTGFLAIHKLAVRSGLLIFTGFMLLNVLTLFFQGGVAWIWAIPLPYVREILFLCSAGMFAGLLLLFVVGSGSPLPRHFNRD